MGVSINYLSFTETKHFKKKSASSFWTSLFFCTVIHKQTALMNHSEILSPVTLTKSIWTVLDLLTSSSFFYNVLLELKCVNMLHFMLKIKSCNTEASALLQERVGGTSHMQVEHCSVTPLIEWHFIYLTVSFIGATGPWTNNPHGAT